jgi:MraZ protein
MAVFTGTHINRLDKKGRVSVPALFRTQLSAAGTFAGLVLYPSFTDQALEGMDHERLTRIAQATDDYATFSPEQNEINSLIFPLCVPLTWDPEGRIALPEDMIAHAGLSDSVAFVGKGLTFQLWEPEAAKRAMEEIRKRAAQRPPTLSLGRPGPAGGNP